MLAYSRARRPRFDSCTTSRPGRAGIEAGPHGFDVAEHRRCIQPAAEHWTTSAKLLPRMGVSLSWQDMSQPASPEHPEYSCLNRGYCSHIPARHWSALHRWRASPASLAAGARHRWLPSRNIGPVACRPAEAGLGISTDGSARVDPQEQAAGQRARIARGPCRTQKPHPLCCVETPHGWVTSPYRWFIWQPPS